MSESKTTTNHDEIRRWVEERGGFPARVKGTDELGAGGVLRIDYPGFTGAGGWKRSIGKNSSLHLTRTIWHFFTRTSSRVAKRVDFQN